MTIKKEILNTIKIIALGAVLGFGVQLVFAQAPTWVGPTAAPPGGNTAAPLTVSFTPQSKAGALGLGKTGIPVSGAILDAVGTISATGLGVFGNVYIQGTAQIAGGSPGAGKVLTSDASGNGSWQNASYDSGWIGPVANAQVKTITHNLGTMAVAVAVYAATNSAGANATLVYYDGDGNKFGALVKVADNNTVKVRLGDNGYRFWNESSNNVTSPSWSNQYLRVVVQK